MTTSGVGTLWLDGVVAQSGLRYHVHVEHAGFRSRVYGRVNIARHEASCILDKQGPNTDLVLQLEDGRRWPCCMKSTRGELLGRGPIS